MGVLINRWLTTAHPPLPWVAAALAVMTNGAESLDLTA
jgi:hypothetical protein